MNYSLKLGKIYVEIKVKGKNNWTFISNYSAWENTYLRERYIHTVRYLSDITSHGK